LSESQGLKNEGFWKVGGDGNCCNGDRRCSKDFEKGDVTGVFSCLRVFGELKGSSSVVRPVSEFFIYGIIYDYFTIDRFCKMGELMV